MQPAKQIKIKGDFITLGQLLKEEGLISTGGAAKWFLREKPVKVNDQPEQRRGKKLRPGDSVLIEEQVYQIE